MKRRWLTMGATAVLATVLVTGCGSGAGTPAPTSTPTPTTTPQPTPSPTPDPVALAVARFAARDLECRFRDEGTADIGGTALTQTGTTDVIADAQHETYEMRVGQTVVEAKEVITIGSKVWERVGTGPWHDARPSGGPAVDALADLTALTVVGQETLDGVQVIHVKPGPGVTLDPRKWGPTDTAVTGLTITAELWIKPDGSLAKLQREAKWTQTSGTSTIPVKATAIETCTTLPTGTTITAPADAWVAYTSTVQGYTISQPSGFKTVTDEGGDSFTYGDQAAISVVSSAADASMSLDDYLVALADSYASQVKATLLMSYDTTVDGQTSKVALFKAKDNSGADIRFIDAIVLHGGKAWEIYIVGLPDTMDADVKYMDQSLTTFEFAS